MGNIIDGKASALLALDSKIALVGTTDDEGCPHLTFLSSLQGLGQTRLTFGQFCTGLSKEFLPRRPDCAFLALSAEMNWLRGNARYTHTATTGPEFDQYNNKPLFRYNAYFGINTVWYLDLLDIGELQKLPMPKIVVGALLSRAAAPLAAKNEKAALSHISKSLLAKLDGLKFLCYAARDGRLIIVPVIQATHAGGDRVVFSGLPYGDDLRGITPGQKVCVLAQNLEMQSVLVKGAYAGKKGAHVVEIERVYNSMPPAAGYAYPRAERPEAVTEF